MPRRSRAAPDGPDEETAQSRLDAYESAPSNTARRAAMTASRQVRPVAEPVADWATLHAPHLLKPPVEPLAVQRKRAAVADLPHLSPRDVDRMRRLITEGLEAAGFDRPHLTLDLKPYAGLRAGLEQDVAGPFRRGERLTMRMADGYVEAPDQAIRGLAAALALRMFSKRRKPPELARLLADYYDVWQRSKDARDLQSRLRRARARKQGGGPRGEVYDLVELTGRVTATFLGGKLKPVKVTWSSRKSYTVLGHHDGDLDTVVLSRALDDPDVPESVVAYVLYHELLHHIMGIQEGPDHNRRLHPPAFRRREQRFPHWAEADGYLDAMCGRRRAIPRSRAKQEWRRLWDEPWDVYPDSARRRG